MDTNNLSIDIKKVWKAPVILEICKYEILGITGSGLDAGDHQIIS